MTHEVEIASRLIGVCEDDDVLRSASEIARAAADGRAHPGGADKRLEVSPQEA
jgi:hypothetical protein